MSNHSVAARRMVAAYRDELQQGEHAEQCCTDVAGCECITHEYLGIPCTVVGATAKRGNCLQGGVVRCLSCGVRWQHRQRRADPLAYVDTAVAA